MSGNNPAPIEPAHFPQQLLLCIRRSRRAARVRAVIEDEQAWPDARRERRELLRRRVMGAPIALPLRRNPFIGSLRIGLVDQHIAALAVLGEARRGAVSPEITITLSAVSNR